MRGTKRYTNTTFTKRVDHEVARNRASRATPEPMVCEQCGALRSGRHWSWPDTAGVKSMKVLGQMAQTHPVLCPACEQNRTHLAEGFLTVEGAFPAKHADDITRLLRNVAERSAARNPMARIIGWNHKDSGELIIATTNGRLALRLGRALRRAFDGEVRITFSHENRLTRVTWRRDV